MSLIVHRCSCGYPDVFGVHRDGCREGGYAGASEVLVTRSTATGDVIEDLSKPGSKFRGFGASVVQLCGCDDCKAVFQSTTGRVPDFPIGGAR